MADFLRGTLSDDIAEASHRHLLECDRCLFAADHADVHDGLTEALESPAGEAADDTDRSVLESLIERLGALAGEAHAPSWTDEELAQVLAPSEADDELGRLVFGYADGDFRVHSIHADGAVRLDESLAPPVSVVLTDQGQQTLPAADLQARFPTAAE